MPRYIQPIKVNGKRRYAVFSTIVMKFMSPVFPSLRAIRKKYPKMPCKRKALSARKRADGSIEAFMKVYRIMPHDLERFKVQR